MLEIGNIYQHTSRVYTLKILQFPYKQNETVQYLNKSLNMLLKCSIQVWGGFGIVEIALILLTKGTLHAHNTWFLESLISL